MTAAIPPDGRAGAPKNEIDGSAPAGNAPARASPSASAAAAPSGKERRRRRRVRMDVGVYLRGGAGTPESFEDRGRTIDVSRDGILMVTERGGYWQGQIVDIVFPYSESPGTLYVPQPARIVRAGVLPDHRHTLGLELNPSAPSHFAASKSVLQVKVLAVESDAALANALRDMLNEAGYLAVVVDSAAAALDVLRSDTPDVILTEVEGDEISGHDLCAIVKTSERLKHIPVILTTRTAHASDYTVGNQLGAVMCVPKPCTAKTMLSAVRLVAPPPSARSAYSARFDPAGFERAG